MSRQELKKNVLKLLKEDEEFRYAVAGFIGMDEVLKGLGKNGAELAKLREDMLKGFERHDAELAKLREDMNALREDMAKGFNLVEKHISALGARWGMMSEEAFREGMRGLLEKEFGFKVERWTCYDEEGNVFGYPSQVEVDVAIHDEKVVLVEVTSHAKASDVYATKRKSALYEKKTGRRASRTLIVTPYAEEEAFKASKELGIEVYTKV
ncbi:MAG: DUF3782 domain-containing protein [Candidatus Brockarchaeota archaeon]|nr:DUF3782 domain-containing protein [Candidatus Brockarchaeota archaeon]